MLRLPHFPDNWLTDDTEVVSATLYPQENSWFSFLLDAESAQGHGSDKKTINFINDMN
jgi:hypothetical protein